MKGGRRLREWPPRPLALRASRRALPAGPGERGELPSPPGARFRRGAGGPGLGAFLPRGRPSPSFLNNAFQRPDVPAPGFVQRRSARLGLGNPGPAAPRAPACWSRDGAARGVSRVGTDMRGVWEVGSPLAGREASGRSVRFTSYFYCNCSAWSCLG